MGSDMNPPKEPQPSQGAGAEEMAEAWIAEQREKRSRWDAMENCYRVDIGIVETWLAGHAKGIEEGFARAIAAAMDQQSKTEIAEKRIAELERELRTEREVVKNYQFSCETLTEQRDTLKAQLETHRALLKEICEQWNEDCDPACDRHAHASGCKSVDIANAKRALQAERDTLKAQLQKYEDKYGSI